MNDSKDYDRDCEGPPMKKLRSSDPDLTIVVGEGMLQRTYYYHSQIMASYSSFVDALLASPMKERENMTITFPEIDPSDWEAMIGYLRPFAPQPTTVAEITRVLPWYGKYQFIDGFQMCDRFLSSLPFDVDHPEKMPDYVEAVGAAYTHNLVATKEVGLDFLRQVFRTRHARIALSTKLISNLVPVILEEAWLWKKIKQAIGPMPALEDKVGFLASPFFPEMLVRALRAIDFESTVEKRLTKLRVRNAGMESVNGVYSRICSGESRSSAPHSYIMKGEHPWDTDFCIQKLLNRSGNSKATWVIFSRQAAIGLHEEQLQPIQQYLYMAADDFAHKLPPRCGWAPYSQHIPSPCPMLKFD